MRLFDYEKLSRLLYERDIDVLLAHTKPNVEYLTDFEWMRWFDKNNLMNEVGSGFVVSFAGLPQDEKKGRSTSLPQVRPGIPRATTVGSKTSATGALCST